MNINIVRISPENKQLWNSFLCSSKNGLFMFHRNYMEYHSDRFEDHSLIFFNEKNEIVALLPLNIVNHTLYSHGGLTFGGFITNSKMTLRLMLDCVSELKQYMRHNGMDRIVYKAVPHIYHHLMAEEDIYALMQNNAHILKVEPSTTLDYNNLLAFSTLRKRQIKKAIKNNVCVEDSLDFASFIDLQNDILGSRYHKKAVHSAEELQMLQSRFPENIKLAVAMYQGAMIAGTVLFVYPEVVHTQYLAASEKAREMGGLDLVMSETIEKYKSQKHYFDFGISTEDGGKYLNDGLVRQKESFGGRTSTHITFEMSTE